MSGSPTILLTGATTGRFLDRFRDAEADPQAYDAAARAELWTRSEQLLTR